MLKGMHLGRSSAPVDGSTSHPNHPQPNPMAPDTASNAQIPQLRGTWQKDLLEKMATGHLPGWFNEQNLLGESKLFGHHHLLHSPDMEHHVEKSGATKSSLTGITLHEFKTSGSMPATFGFNWKRFSFKRPVSFNKFHTNPKTKSFNFLTHPGFPKALLVLYYPFNSWQNEMPSFVPPAYCSRWLCAHWASSSAFQTQGPFNLHLRSASPNHFSLKLGPQGIDLCM